MKVRRAGVTASLLAVGGLALSACYSGNLSGPRTGIVGDSITVVSAPDIEADIAPNYAYQVQATNGYTIAQGEGELNTIDTDPEGSPVDVVINLGTNDAVQQNPNWQTDWNNLIAEVDPAGCVILTTLRPILDYQRVIPVADDINAEIASLVQNDPHFHELDWATFSDDNPQDISTDGVHPNAQGQADLAAMVSWTLHQDCGDPGGE
jgi:lysophospholipase L1-like esterase